MTAVLERSPSIDRFLDPLFTIEEASRFLAVPPSTFRAWSQGSRGINRDGVRRDYAPVLTALPSTGQRTPVIPFIGLAEGLVLTAIRQSGVPLQRIRPALDVLRQEFDLTHALASSRLYTDGAEVLFDYAQRHERDEPEAAHAIRELVVLRSHQRVFSEVVEKYLKKIEFGPDGFARLVRLPAYEVADVVVDPSRAFGQPVFAHGGARLDDFLALFRAGESIASAAKEYGVRRRDAEDVIRVATRAAS